MQIQKDKRRVEHKVVPWTTGFVFPEAGGLLDQPNWLMAIFVMFQAGDRDATYKQLKS